MPILPIAIAGTRNCMAKGSFAFRHAHAKARVLAPIPTDGLTLADLGALRDRTRATIDAARRELQRELAGRGCACRLSRRRRVRRATRRSSRSVSPVRRRRSRALLATVPGDLARARRRREDGTVARAHGQARRSARAASSPCRAGAIAPPPPRSRPTASRRSAPTCSIRARSPRCPTRRTSSSWRDRSSARRAIPPTTWAMNAAVPAFVAERYAGARTVVFSTGNVYALTPPERGGSRESDPPAPVGEYAYSCLARERIFAAAAARHGTPVVHRAPQLRARSPLRRAHRPRAPRRARRAGRSRDGIRQRHLAGRRQRLRARGARARRDAGAVRRERRRHGDPSRRRSRARARRAPRRRRRRSRERKARDALLSDASRMRTLLDHPLHAARHAARLGRRLGPRGRTSARQADELRASAMAASDRSAALRASLGAGVVIPAHPLALTADRTLDERHQRALTRYYVDAGAGGIAVGVHTTQFAIRRPEHGLYRPVLELAAETAREWLGATSATVRARRRRRSATRRRPSPKRSSPRRSATTSRCSASARCATRATRSSSRTAAPSPTCCRCSASICSPPSAGACSATTSGARSPRSSACGRSRSRRSIAIRRSTSCAPSPTPAATTSRSTRATTTTSSPTS